MPGVRIAVLLLAFLAFAGTAGAAEAPKGIDVSHWQGQIGWLQVGAGGYDFAFAKATEGTTYIDPTYVTNRAGATAAGLRLGAYHFARPVGTSDAAAIASGIAQADYFVATAQPKRGDLLPVLDLEKTGGLGVTRLTTWTQAFLDQVYARLGAHPLVYASPSFWKTSLGDTPLFAADGNRLWIAHWTKASLPLLPAAGWNGLGWTFWQWTSCSSVPGIGGCVDGDRVNGSSLSPGLMPATAAGPPASSEPPAVVGTPQSGRLLVATAGGWSGGKPASFTYEWQRCTAAGDGCAPITNATKSTYTPVAADVGHALVASVTATTAGGSDTADSVPTLAVASSGTTPSAAPKATKLPTVLGVVQAGQTLTGASGTWTGAPKSYAYQWRRCPAVGTTCTVIAGASASTYLITPGDIASKLSLVVTATGTGGSSSASSVSTAVVAPAPVPTPIVGSTTAALGQAGAVTTADAAAVASWQPGAVPPGTTVSLASSPSRLSVPGFAVALGVGTPAPFPWPIDVTFGSAADDVVPGILPGRGVFRAIPELAGTTLPEGQETGAYRDSTGGLHVLTRRSGRIALFTPGAWGDPRYATTARPRMTLVSPVLVGHPSKTVVLVRSRFTLDSQARLAVTVVRPTGRRVTLLRKGSRIGDFLPGGPTNTLKTVQLRPGALPLRIRVLAKQLRPGVRYRVRIALTDPYLRHSTLSIDLPARR